MAHYSFIKTTYNVDLFVRTTTLQQYVPDIKSMQQRWENLCLLFRRGIKRKDVYEWKTMQMLRDDSSIFPSFLKQMEINLCFPLICNWNKKHSHKGKYDDIKELFFYSSAFFSSLLTNRQEKLNLRIFTFISEDCSSRPNIQMKEEEEEVGSLSLSLHSSSFRKPLGLSFLAN